MHRIALRPLVSLVLAPALAAEPITWESIELVDADADALAHGVGRAVAYVEDGWLVTYVSDGEVVVRTRDDDTGWGPATVLTSGAGAVHAPQVVYAGGTIHVIWEDERAGHREIYTRRDEGGGWTAEECLSCDDVRSACAALAGRDRYETDTTDAAQVVWEDGEVGSTAIRGRRYHDGAWEPVADISASPSSAREPAVDGTTGFTVSWTDTRNGHADIYVRSGTTVSNLTADLDDDATRSSIRVEYRETDFTEVYWLVTFASTYLGSERLFQVFIDRQSLTPVATYYGLGDTIAATSFSRQTGQFCAFWGGVTGQGEWLASQGAGVDGARPLVVTSYDGFPAGVPVAQEVMTSAGIGDLHLGTYEGVPHARMLALWIEDDGGTPTLKARRGFELGGNATRVVETSPSMIISPGGTIATTAAVEDIYTGASVDCDACLYIDADGVILDTGETEVCEEPPSPFAWHVRGGGCDPLADVAISSPADELGPGWRGIRSPDVDGNCIVDGGDQVYVLSMEGTDDFCADLDGSGVVDAADVAIVEMTLGDACASVAVNEMPGAARPELAVAPNPARVATYVRVSVPAPADAVITVLDAAGRRIRELPLTLDGGSTLVPWDLRDANGRRVGAGRYFVRTSVGDLEMGCSLTVLE